jgi:hypothetical protein
MQFLLSFYRAGDESTDLRAASRERFTPTWTSNVLDFEMLARLISGSVSRDRRSIETPA